MARGNYVSQEQIQRIASLLANTDVPIAMIAERFHCSKSVVASINRRHQIRLYKGRRNSWECAGETSGISDAIAVQ